MTTSFESGTPRTRNRSAMKRSSATTSPHASEDEAVDRLEQAARQIGRFDLAHRDELIGVEIHRPVRDRHPPQERRRARPRADQRRRRAEEDPAQLGVSSATQSAWTMNEARAEHASEDRLFAERRERQPADVHAVQICAGGIP